MLNDSDCIYFFIFCFVALYKSHFVLNISTAICKYLHQSAYEVKNNLCLFESPFKIQKSGVFVFEISFFVLEISTFFYYANLISDDVILFATKMWKILNK